MPNTPNDNETPLFFRAFFLDILFDKRTRPFFIYVLIIIGIGTTIYHWLEGWGWLDSIYFVVITLTTIGYGDLHPTQPLTKLITIFYSVNGVILLLLLFDIIRTVRGWSVPKMKEKAKEYRSLKNQN